MLLAKAYRREREFAIRLSIGATPLQIAKQLLLESSAIALASKLLVLAQVALSALTLSATGIWYTTRQFVRQSRKEMSIRLAIGPTPGSLLALTLRRSLTLGSLLMTATLFTIAFAASYLPARSALKADPRDALSEV